MVRLPAGNGPSIRLCARAWWISVLSSVQVNRFTCASRKVLYCGAAKDFPRISKSGARWYGAGGEEMAPSSLHLTDGVP